MNPMPVNPMAANPMVETSVQGSSRNLERRLDRLTARAEEWSREHGRARSDLVRTREFLDLAPPALDTLEGLSTALFGEMLDEIEQNLTFAIQEILGQERSVFTQREVKSGRLHVSFLIRNPAGAEESDGDGGKVGGRSGKQGQLLDQTENSNNSAAADQGAPQKAKKQDDRVEDILTGQGGSVANIISVGLRLIALSQLDPAHHRPFLVLDEQDCWLRPALVPKFMKLIAEIAARLELQVLAISHHPLDLFAGAADTIYALHPDRDKGVRLETLKPGIDQG